MKLIRKVIVIIDRLSYTVKFNIIKLIVNQLNSLFGTVNFFKIFIILWRNLIFWTNYYVLKLYITPFILHGWFTNKDSTYILSDSFLVKYIYDMESRDYIEFHINDETLFESIEFIFIHLLIIISTIILVKLLTNKNNSNLTYAPSLKNKLINKNMIANGNQKKHYHTSSNLMKQNTIWSPISFNTTDIKELPFNNATTVSTRHVGHKNSYKVIQSQIPSLKKNKPFHMLDFVVYDLETIMSNGKLVPYILGWTIVKQTKIGGYTFKSNTILLELNATDSMIQDSLKSMFENISKEIKSKEIIIIAHNGGRFDIKVILNPLLQMRAKELIKINHTISSPTNEVFELSITYLPTNTKFLFRDSYKVISSPVSNISKMFLGQVSKMYVNHDMLNNELANLKDLNTWTTALIEATNGANSTYQTPADYLCKYCLIDCEVVARALIKFSQSVSENMDAAISAKSMITISSTAMNLFLQKFHNMNKTPIMEIPLTSALSSWLKKAYIGGRTEVFHSGINISPIYHFDVPGMYARCIQMPLPVGNPVYVSDYNNKMDMKYILDTLDNNSLIGFFECTVITPKDLHLPVLPVKHNGKLTFPLGTFKGIWTTYELQLALDKGYIITPHSGYIFKAGTPLKDYSTTLTTIKDQAQLKGDQVTRNTAKLLLNTLYGKFARTYYGTATIIISKEELSRIEGLYEILSITETDSNMLIVNYNTKPLSNASNKFPKQIIDEAFKQHLIITRDKTTNIAIAATITSHGRIILYKLYEEVIKRGGKMCYSDTDSVYAYLPESPFNKPFGPFIWDGKPEDNTYNKSLFIAPKMYYTESISGKITFKVKGSSTKLSQYTYTDLLNCFLNNTPIVFKNQLAFKRLTNKGKYIGLKMIDDLIKTYNIFASNKRDWIQVENTFETTPLVLDKTIVQNNIDISKWDVNKFEDLKMEMKDLIIKKVNSDEYIYTNMKSHIITDHNIAVTSVNNAKINDQDFKEVWMYLITVASANTEKLNKLEMLERLIITAYDPNINIHKTVSIITGSSWMAMKPEYANSLIKSLVDNAIMEYGDEFIPTTITFKLYFKTLPQLVEYTNIDRIYTTTFLKIVDRSAEKEKLVKLIKDSQDQLSSLQLSEKDEQTFKAFEKELKAKYPAVEHFIAQSKLVIRTIIANKEGIFNKNSLDRLLYAFNKTMIDNCFWTIHSLRERIIDRFKLDRTSPEQVKESLHMAWEILINLYHKDILGMTAMNVEEGKYTIKKMHKFLPKSSEVHSWIMLKHLSTGISFSPVIVDSSKHISKDMVDTINKLNSTPIRINKEYLQWLVSEIMPRLDLPAMQSKIGWDTPEQKERMYIAFKRRMLLLTLLNDLITKLGATHFYMQWKHDFRGRLYPKLTNISHISHKFMRPLFLLNSKDIILTLLKDTLSGKTKSLMHINYMKLIERTLGCNVQILETTATMKQILTLIITIVTDPSVKMDWNKCNRVLEIMTLIEKGKVTPAPMQLDSTCNVIQHMSSIRGNTEIMKTIGLITDESYTKDFYTTIATKVLQYLKEETQYRIDLSQIFTINQLSTIFENIDITILREIVKKPTITKAYAAKYISAMEYIRDRLLKQDINLTNTQLKALTDALIGVLSETLSQEITLMSIMQNLVKKATKAISWTISPISDFKVYMENMKRYIHQTKLHTTVEGRKIEIHTTYKVITTTPNNLKNKNSIFVNVIHSLDALHISLILKGLDKDMLPIHDAVIIPMNTDLDDVINVIHSTFLDIHGRNTTYKRITNQICQQIGDITLYEYVISLPTPQFRFNRVMWKLV